MITPGQKKNKFWIWATVLSIVCIFILLIITIVSPRGCKQEDSESPPNEDRPTGTTDTDNNGSIAAPLSEADSSDIQSEEHNNNYTDNDDDNDNDNDNTGTSSYRPPSRNNSPSNLNGFSSNYSSSSSVKHSSSIEEYKDLDDLDEEDDDLYYFHTDGLNEIEDAYYDDNNMYENYDNDW